MVKSTIILLTGLGVVGTGGPAVAPQALEVSVGAVTTEFTAEGIVSRENSRAELGVTWVTKGNKRITIRF